MKKLILTLLTFSLILSGCATSVTQDRVSPSYVSPIPYQSYTCEQIRSDLKDICKNLVDVSDRMSATQRANGARFFTGACTAALIAVPVPALFSKGSGPDESEFADLYGRFNCLSEVAKKKGCDISDIHPTPQEIIDQIKKDREEIIKSREPITRSRG